MTERKCYRFFSESVLVMLIALNLDQAAVSKFYVAPPPVGNDQNSGTSALEPVETLGRIQELLGERKLCGLTQADSVEVHISPGTYARQEVHWTCFTGAPIIFTAANFSKVRPVFDGRGSADTWFWVEEQGADTKLRFRYIKVQNYCTAMSFRGSGGVELYGMYFHSIGSRFGLDGKPGCSPTAAVAFHTSGNNRVVNSHFVDVVNEITPGRLHALYISHGASGNLIERNRFVRVNGDPVKTRDRSNHNRVFNNEFHQTGRTAYYLEGFDPSSGECPSYGNEFRFNQLHGGFSAAVKVFELQHEPPDAETLRRCGSSPEPRLRTKGNVKS